MSFFYRNKSKTSVQFSCSVVSDSLRPHQLQHAGLPCPSPTPGACSDSCPSSWWCHPAISSSCNACKIANVLCYLLLLGLGQSFIQTPEQTPRKPLLHPPRHPVLGSVSPTQSHLLLVFQVCHALINQRLFVCSHVVLATQSMFLFPMWIPPT